MGEIDTHGTAVLVIDTQVDVLALTVRRAEVVAAISEVVDRARGAGVPVVWIRHHDEDELPFGSPGWQITPELVPGPGEATVEKASRDSFHETDLAAVLERLGVDRLVVAGAHTDFCVSSTLHGAVARGFGAVLVSDAHTAEDLREWGGADPESVVDHLNMTWSGYRIPGRLIGTVTSGELVFGAGDRSDG